MAEDRSNRHSRRYWGAMVAVVVAGAVTVSTAMPAAAIPPPPPNPSDQQIQASEDHAQMSAAEVGKLSGRISTTQAKIQRLQDAMELKAELAMKARVDLEVAQTDAANAKKAATKAQHAADHAGGAIVTAKQKAAKFAAASFRQGSVLGSMTALLDADSLDQLVARQQMIDQVSDTQLGVINNLESARSTKANLDSKAREALDAATAAEQKAQQAKKAADEAKAAAEKSFQEGQQQLASLQTKLTQQQAEYQAALNKVADLKGQRQQYNLWLQAQQAEQQRLQEQAERQAAQARATLAAKQQAAQAEQAIKEANAAKAIAVKQEKHKQAKILAEKIRKEKERLARIKAAKEKAAREKAAREKAAREKAAREAAAREAAEKRAAERQAQQQQQQSSGDDGGSSGTPHRSTGGSSGGSSSPPPSNLSRGQQVVQAALAWLGTPYAWGGGTYSGPSRGIHDWGTADYYGDYNKIGFDCSGLALYAWAQVGVYLPHYSAYQYYSGQHVSVSNLQPGDLVFYAYNTSDPSTIHHVAIYMGNNQIVQAPYSGATVEVAPMRWSGYIGATRPGT